MEASTMKSSASSSLFIQLAALILFFLLSLLRSSVTVSAQIRFTPPVAAINARWLMAQNSWGVLSTISVDLGGAPFGNVVSFSDGEPGHGFGVPYFYLAELEPKEGYEINGTRAALTVSEDPLGTCRKDTQDPKCKRATLIGKLKWISLENPEIKFAQVALFTKHPEMKDWHLYQNFQIYKLDLEGIFIAYKFGSPMQLKWISLENPEIKFAQVALFTKHPEMKYWHCYQNFQIYKLDLEGIFIAYKFGSPVQVTLKDYLKFPPL